LSKKDNWEALVLSKEGHKAGEIAKITDLQITKISKIKKVGFVGKV
jgi:hypothetical protein